MKYLTTLAIAFLLQNIAFAGDPSGFWKGGIKLPNGGLPIEVSLEQEEDTWKGAISIPPQGIRDMELIDVSITEEHIRFALPGIPGDPKFDGTLDEEGRIKGTFTQAGQTLKFGLKRADPASKAQAASVVPTKGQPGEGAVGDWGGILSIGPSKLQLVLHATQKENGSLAGTFDSIDQGAKGIPIDVVTFEDGKLDFYIAAFQAGFIGTLNEDGSAFVGEWEQQGAKAALTLFRMK